MPTTARDQLGPPYLGQIAMVMLALFRTASWVRAAGVRVLSVQTEPVSRCGVRHSSTRLTSFCVGHIWALGVPLASVCADSLRSVRVLVCTGLRDLHSLSALRGGGR